MRVGKLRHRIEIYKNTELQNEYGEMELKQEKIATIWASIDALKSDEKYINLKESSVTSLRIEIRYFKGLDESHIIKFKGREFNIKSVINPYERDERMILMCDEIKRGYK